MTFNMNASNRTITDAEAGQFKSSVRTNVPSIPCLQKCRYKSFVKIRECLDSIYTYTSTQGLRKNKKYILYIKFPLHNFRQNIDHKIYATELKIKGKWVAVYSCHLISNGYTADCQNICIKE